MKFSESWLRQWVEPKISTDELVAQITMAGLEVDSVAPAAPQISGVVVGEILSVEQHPQADKLKICQVAGAGDSPVQVVCGAANARSGIKVPFATVGAQLPDGLKIKKAKLRGAESHGMLCGQTELNLGDDDSGLWELPENMPIGEDLVAALQLDDQIIEVDLTPNRADCLSIRGLAREVGVLNQVAVAELQVPAVEAVIDDSVGVSIEAPEACGRYVGRVIKGVDLSRKTPQWMQEKLRRSDIRCLGPAVDITNYVMLELGQPMHAFDRSKIEGDIVVRMGRDEPLRLLDDSEVSLAANTVVIADQVKPLAMAGIMGGSDSAVSDDTGDILLESAWFNPIAIAGKARNYGKHTDSSHRFERGVDSELQIQAMERATQLMLEICGGQPGPLSHSEQADNLPQPAIIQLRDQHLTKQLGVAIATDQIDRILSELGLTLQTRDDQIGVWQAPSWRFDLAIEQDLVEEIARIYGYNKLPVTTPAMAVELTADQETARPAHVLASRLVAMGYQEAITYSFVDPDIRQALDPDREAVKVANPISQDLSAMRTNLWPGLLTTAIYNLNRQQSRVRLFEIGQCFIPCDDSDAVAGCSQNLALAGLICGSRTLESWASTREPVDFYDLKGDLESLLADSCDSDKFKFTAANHPALHPGQSAEITHNDQSVGWIGRLHPQLEAQYDLNKSIYLFQVDVDKISEVFLPKAKDISKFPEVRRDLAFAVDPSVTADDLLSAAREAAGENLADLKLFDVYQSKDLDNKGKSIALGLTFQNASRTLTDEEINLAVNAVVKKLADLYSADLRS